VECPIRSIDATRAYLAKMRREENEGFSNASHCASHFSTNEITNIKNQLMFIRAKFEF
jgi:hypothetical protein